MQDTMHSRSKYWLAGLIVCFMPLNVYAEEICNNSETEQIITDGVNEQYIPPHMCVSANLETSEIKESSEVIIEEELIEINVETEEVESNVSNVSSEEIEQVSKENPEEVYSTVESVESSENDKKYYEILLIPIILLILFFSIRRYQ